MLIQHVFPCIQNKNLLLLELGKENFASVAPSKQAQEYANFSIHFVLSGEGKYHIVNGDSDIFYEIKEHMVFAVYKNNVICFDCPSETPFHYFWIGFDGEESKELLDYIGFSETSPIVSVHDWEKAEELFQDLFNVWETQDKYLFVSKFYSLLNVLRGNNVIENKILRLNDSTILFRAEKFIKDNINKNIKVQDLTAFLNIDRSYFSKLFKKHYGITPHDFIIETRLSKASMLLLTTDYSIEYISDLLNFSDIYSFSKLFKKYYGHSPSQQRKLYRQKK